MLPFPQMAMAMVLITFLGPSTRNTMLSLILIGWPQYAQVMRSQVLLLRMTSMLNRPSILGARCYAFLSRYILCAKPERRLSSRPS